MSIRRLLGLAALGGLFYAHKRHGGQLNVNSIKQSGRDLVDAAKSRSENLRTKASNRMREVADKVGQRREDRETIIEEVTTQATGYDYNTGYPQR